MRAAVPEGASSFRSWCSSMISALSMYRAASAANRIMSTAPMAKLGAIAGCQAGLGGGAQLVDLILGQARGADHGVDARREREGARWR